jgi:hypothetical protein
LEVDFGIFHLFLTNRTEVYFGNFNVFLTNQSEVYFGISHVFLRYLGIDQREEEEKVKSISVVVKLSLPQRDPIFQPLQN